MKVVALMLAMFFAVTARSQNTINNYKYVLVPQRFDIFKQDDQYGLSTLTKSYLENLGFMSFMTNDPLPADIVNNKCSALKAELVEKKKFLATSLSLVLKDCQGNVVYKGQEGISREKEWSAAYREALAKAFVSLTAAQYKYDSTGAIQAAQPTQTAQIPQTTPSASPAPVAATPATISENKDVLYAQANANGYQLIDTSPKKVMTLLKTSQPDNFIADNGVEKGIVFKKNGEWYFEYYKNDKLVSQQLSIKF
ncbi:hypothetical protein [Chitinophaga pinensis]|uniref:Uncharacterized protein n=1 Tax=Chitinophaga pinensis (strain ATCC 43595 / DSM 2588 / LMG 13176 / NBRC 15968 / NCIMB 11800 / UQM 2034) TaxID=485918 RepID=A0A979GB06_CHIPD|nr:hypothetical protein [Chitinophaga pinensis]ACU64091.1 hypothetical protein Cpin_6688 [Chitinophaga pinensis DSM 2588]